MLKDARAAAARNNAEWCDIVCGSHGLAGRTDDEAWSVPRRSPQWYPDAVTLRPGVDAEALLARIDAGPGASVKDSFADLDLSGYGFRVLFDAQWIHRPPSAPPADTAAGPGHHTRRVGGLGSGPRRWGAVPPRAPDRPPGTGARPPRRQWCDHRRRGAQWRRRRVRRLQPVHPHRRLPRPSGGRCVPPCPTRPWSATRKPRTYPQPYKPASPDGPLQPGSTPSLRPRLRAQKGGRESREGGVPGAHSGVRGQ